MDWTEIENSDVYETKPTSPEEYAKVVKSYNQIPGKSMSGQEERRRINVDIGDSRVGYDSFNMN